MVHARKQKPAAINVYLLSRFDIVIRYIEVWAFGLLLGFWILFFISKSSLYQGSIPYILLKPWPGHRISFVTSRTSLNRGSLNRGSTVLGQKGKIYWPIFQLAELVFFRAST